MDWDHQFLGDHNFVDFMDKYRVPHTYNIHFYYYLRNYFIESFHRYHNLFEKIISPCNYILSAVTFENPQWFVLSFPKTWCNPFNLLFKYLHTGITNINIHCITYICKKLPEKPCRNGENITFNKMINFTNLIHKIDAY